MARNRYEYSTSPRKLEPDYSNRKQTKKNKMRIAKDLPERKTRISTAQRKKQMRITLIVIAVFIALLTISYRNSQINEKFSQVQGLKKELSSIQKENEQLKVNIENGLNLNNIEKLAKEKLGMQKLTNKQTIYISLPKKDYVESDTEDTNTEDNENWFQKLVNKIFNKK